MKTLARWGRKFGLTRAICVLLLLALVPLRVLDPPPLQEVRLRTFDFYQSLRPRQTESRPVVIVDIDEILAVQNLCLEVSICHWQPS
jgi:adenylate cyclase